MQDDLSLGSPSQTSDLIPHAELTFNFARALPGRASSRHTERAYFRWVDRYLVDLTQLEPTNGLRRQARMERLPIARLLKVLNAPHLRAWLGQLNQQGHGKQGIDQARAAIVTLADLLAEAELVDDYIAAGMSRVRPPRAEEGQRPGRWLSIQQIQQLMRASQEFATSDNQALRNGVILQVLCTMALRREELAVARWNDLSLQNGRMVWRVHGKGKKTAVIDVPQSVASRLRVWQQATQKSRSGFQLASPIVRRLWKGGEISPAALSEDSIWAIVSTTSELAGIGHVAPHDLRRSVAGALQESGLPIDKISQLLRHNNVAVTERYLSRLPQVNEGAVVMSDLLGLNTPDEGSDWLPR
ncbi:MAG: tyrosine-type recombinase/integrase [Phototrophicaceae bacterium]